MSLNRDRIISVLSTIAMPDNGDLASRDMIRALTIDGGHVSFLIEAPSPDVAAKLEPQRRAAESAVAALDGVEKVTVILTAHGAGTPSAAPAEKPAPSLRVGGIPPSNRACSQSPV